MKIAAEYYLDGLQRWEHRWEKCVETMLKNKKISEKMSCIFVGLETFQTTLVYQVNQVNTTYVVSVNVVSVNHN